MADYIKICHPTDGREGYLRKPLPADFQEAGEYFEKSQPLVDIYGKSLPYRFLPYYEGKLATRDEVIYLGSGEDGWPALIQAYGEFKKNAKPFTYHTFFPCVGETVKVTGREGGVFLNGKKTSHSILALGRAFENFAILPKEIIGELEEQYFLEAYKDHPVEDYFDLLSKGGIFNVIKIAQNNGHIYIAEKLKTWLDVGMTDAESRNVWINHQKDDYHNRTYFWKGVVVCYESYGLDYPRVKKICEITPQEIEEVKAQKVAEEQARIETRKKKFQELSKAVTEKYGEVVLKLTLRKKGSVLAILKMLSESTAQVELAELKKIFALSSEAPVIANLMTCVAGEVDPFKAAKVAKKAYAWAYLSDALPGVYFKGYFDAAKTALEIYSKNW